jgi:predicted ATPase
MRRMHLKKAVLNVERLSSDDRYPFNIPVLKTGLSIDLASPVTFFVGENGSGKSTLMRALARRCGIFIWGGSDPKPPAEEPLTRALEIEWADEPVPGSFFSSQLFYNFSQIVEEWAEADPFTLKYFGGHSLLTLSHGQSLMTYFQARYQLKGLYFLDEPETALSPKSQLALLKVLTAMSRAGHAQFIIASHSPVLLSCPRAKLFDFNGETIRSIDYEATEYYRFYRDFMMNHRAYLERS